jgi:hypothetical protein
MFKSISALSLMACLPLALACGRPLPEARDGHLALTLDATSDASDGAAPVALTITGLSRHYQARVSLARSGAAETTELALPAGLYTVEDAASSAPGEPETSQPVPSLARVVVVAAGQVSSVHVRDPHTAEVAALSALDVDRAGH